MGDIWLSSWMWILIIVLFILATYITYRLFVDEEKRQEVLEKEEDTPQNEIERSLEYETTSISKNVKRLSWIYAISIIAGIVIFFIYSFYFYS